MNFLIFDFETNGSGVNNNDNYNPYDCDKMPLPIPNFPIQISAILINSDGKHEETYTTFIKGAIRMDPWVKEHISHITVERCENEGVTFENMVNYLNDMCSRKETILVAHNIYYDWNVLINTCKYFNFQINTTLLNCKQICTMYNTYTLNNKIGLKYAYYWKSKKIYIGPSLKTLAKFFNIDFDENNAHDAAYDAEITKLGLLEYLKITQCSNLLFYNNR